MVDVDDLLRYLPSQHGEHGVDATLHMLARKNTRFHEVFSNPPGGSWAVFDIWRPSTTEVYRWDHMPRVPGAKRPDFVLQFTDGQVINFILMESKQAIQDAYPRMGVLLTQFFTGSRNYLGLKKRPAWHRKKINEAHWRVIPPDEDDDIRYWFREWPEMHTRFWPAFTFAVSPEFIMDLDNMDKRETLSQLTDLLGSRTDLDIVILIGWTGEYHEPFAIRAYSEEFARTDLARELDRLLDPVLVE